MVWKFDNIKKFSKTQIGVQRKWLETNNLTQKTGAHHQDERPHKILRKTVNYSSVPSWAAFTISSLAVM